MRIRTAVTCLALGAASLLLAAPVAFAADTQPQPPTSSRSATEAPAPGPAVRTAPSTPVETTSRPRPDRGVVTPKGAPETGGGMEDEGPGVFLVGGAALLATGGVGAVAFRRLRKQS